MVFIATYNYFQFVLKHPCSCDIYIIFLITRDQNLNAIIIEISEHGVYFLSVLTMACMQMQFLTNLQETAENAQRCTTCDAGSTRAKNSNQALSFNSCFEKKSGSPGQTYRNRPG